MIQVKSHPLKYDFHNSLDSNTQTMTDVVTSKALMRKKHDEANKLLEMMASNH